MNKLDVAVIMGSKSDLEVMQKTIDVLNDFGIAFEVRIFSAHRTPELLSNYIKEATDKKCRVFIAAAGCAAHLAGCIAGQTIFPVIGVPLAESDLKGIDALLSTVQMPGGVPVATVAIGGAGAKNAAILAVQMLALSDQTLQEKLKGYKIQMIDAIYEANKTHAKDYNCK